MKDAAPAHGVSDLMLWLLGASVLLVACFLPCSHFFRIHFFSLPFLAYWLVLAGVFVIVPLAIAFSSRRAGLPKSLLYIPLVLAIPYTARKFGLWSVLGVVLYDPAGHGMGLSELLQVVFGRYSVATPILIGAIAGWALRRWRG